MEVVYKHHLSDHYRPSVVKSKGHDLCVTHELTQDIRGWGSQDDGVS